MINRWNFIHLEKKHKLIRLFLASPLLILLQSLLKMIVWKFRTNLTKRLLVLLLMVFIHDAPSRIEKELDVDFHFTCCLHLFESLVSLRRKISWKVLQKQVMKQDFHALTSCWPHQLFIGMLVIFFRQLSSEWWKTFSAIHEAPFTNYHIQIV